MNPQFTREEIISSIKKIDENPILTSGRQSSTYDLIYENKKYPPILVLSVANEEKNGSALTLSDFGNSTEAPFRILRDNGFEIRPKSLKMKPDLKEFIRIADQQETGKGTSNSATAYARENKGIKEGLNIEISFGKGRATPVPWIAFTGYNQTVTDGIYPVYLYYKDFNILILAYGVSETNKPSLQWKNIGSRKTVKEYFQTHHSEKLEKYGSSFVYKVYNVNALPPEEEMNADLDQIIKEYHRQLSDQDSKQAPTTSMTQFSMEEFHRDLAQSGLIYSAQLSTRFVASLLTKPFVILTGLSGSGKTKLAQTFVQWICEDKAQYRMVPVGADWTNREPLLGYPNALNPKEYVKPDTGVLDLIIQAGNSPELPHFLILDEMNLSHVERYFADFLSVMESKEEIPLHSSNEIDKAIPKRLSLPPNLFIIGTVNIDETTHMFSPKVLDRANTIEFRISEKEMSDFLKNTKPLNLSGLVAKGAGMGKSFLELAGSKAASAIDRETIDSELLRFFSELKKTGAEFGYRSATEIMHLIHQLGVLDASLTTRQKLDVAIMQKLLPKLHGSRRKLCPVLETLASFCVQGGDIQVQKDIFEKDDFDFDKALYPLSLEKITRMYKGAVDNGFTSFAEA